MSLFPQLDDNAVFLAQSDPDEPLSSYSAHSFSLDDENWPTVMHYYQAKKFEDTRYQKKIALAESPKAAQNLGRNRFKKRRKDWKTIKIVMMTRAVYTKMKTHPDIAQLLLNTDDKQIVESNNYDYFWGCGRDRRGENHYGKVLMAVREKLREEA